MWIHQKYKTKMRTIFQMLLVLAAIQIISWLAPPFNNIKGIANYEPLHTLLEFISIIISTLVFSVLCGSCDKARSGNFSLLAYVFIGVAILDFLHTISYQGMPDFITPSGPEKAIDFWLAGRLLSALGLFVFSFLSWRSVYSIITGWLALLVTVLFILTVTTMVLWFPELTPQTFIAGQGLTTFKVVSEYCLVILYFMTALRFLQQMRTPQPYDIVNMFAAVSVMAMSEVFFTLYANVTDIFNLLGHIYKVTAYSFVYKSIFISSIREPYQRLFESRSLLQSVIEAIPLRVFWKDHDLRYLGCNTLFANDAGKSNPSEVINRYDTQLAWKEQASLYRADDSQVMQDTLPKLAYEEPQTNALGEQTWLRTSKVPLYDLEHDVIGILGIYEDITQQKKAEHELNFMRTAIAKSKSSFFKLSSSGQVLYANNYACQCLGYRTDELQGKYVWEFDPDFSADDWSSIWENLKITEGSHFETRHQRKDGTIYPVEVNGNYIVSDGEDEYTFAFTQDISARKQAEYTQEKLSRALKLLSQCNALLIHASNEQVILDAICKLAVEVGGYRMAWVGLKENDAIKSVRPVARSGDELTYIDNIKITWDDTGSGQGPTGTAIRTQNTVINQDYLTNQKMAPWRDRAIQYGYQASIALPLVSSTHVLGALSIYSGEANTFVAEEVRLLEELANDLAYGLDVLRVRKVQKETEKRVEFLAYHDPLTKLPNRLLLRDRFDQAIAVACREHSMVAVLFLDLDNFKQVNDSLGHTVGDRLLVQAVERIQQCIRTTDTISRQGGDEFIVLLTDQHDVATVDAIAQKIIDTFISYVSIDEYALNVSFSIGISLFPNDSDSFDELLKQADTALYQAKDAGKNTYRFFSEQMNIDAIENMQLQTQLHNALKNNELLLYYQPQINTLTEELIGAEALLRWQHPELGLVSPAKFIPLAERSGLIIDIGEWVLNEACKQAQIWNAGHSPAISIAVNLSALQLKRGNIIDTVMNALAQSGLPANLLELELTESILLNDLSVALETLQKLKAIGVRFSIDDFGTGYSSLSYLKKLAVDKLKIDQSFVQDMAENPDDVAIVHAIIQMGHTLQLTVIAEGVETAKQVAILKEYQCDELQGYFYSKPISGLEFTEKYTKN